MRGLPSERTEVEIVAHCKKAMKASDKNSWDVADDYEALARPPFNWSQKRISEEFGVSPQSVCRFLNCVSLFPLVEDRPLFWEAFQKVNGKTNLSENEQERFDIFSETEAVFQWLWHRRDKWPEQFRHEFALMITTCVERMEAEDDGERRFGGGSSAAS